MKSYSRVAALFAALVLLFCLVSCQMDGSAGGKSYVAAVEITVTPTTTAGRYSVTMTCSTEGAAIYYTTDRRDPTTSSTLYSGPITVNAGTTIKAIAVKEGMENSPVVPGYVFVNQVEVTAYRNITTEAATNVYHWKQNVEGTDYTLCKYASDGIKFVTDTRYTGSEGTTTTNENYAALETEALMVAANTAITEIEKTIPGFAAVGVITSKQNDGSVVANVYYNRNYVTVTVDANTGSFGDDNASSATFRGLYGHEIEGLDDIRAPNTNKSLLCFEPALNFSSPTFPSENTTYRAIWSRNTAATAGTDGSYTVTAANFASTLNSISSSNTAVTIKVTETVSNEQLREFKTVLNNKSNVNFSLDLSRAQGLTEIADDTSSGLFNCENLVSITLPRITKIGDFVFQNCTNFTSITIPDSVTSIGKSTFAGCTKLTSLTIPNSVTSIGDNAFRDCTDLTSITISNRATAIEKYAFAGCTRLATINIPASVTSIGDYAFEGCSALATITIRGSVTSIGNGAFNECVSLESITLPSSLVSLGESAFAGSGLTRITVPSNVTAIKSYTFRGCDDLETVTILDSVLSIGNNAFEGCSSITNITIPESVTSIGLSAFSGCTSLASVTIPTSVTSIGARAFDGCSALASITIPSSLSSFKASMLRGCALTSINIPYVGTNQRATQASSSTLFGAIFETASATGLTSITQNYSSTASKTYYVPSGLTTVTVAGGKLFYGAFNGCSTITSLTLGKDVVIDSNAEKLFNGCTNLSAITVVEENASYKSVDGVLYSHDGTELIAYPIHKTGTSFTIPDTVTKIHRDAFSGCTNLTSITIPNGVTSIGSDAFSGCTGITSMTIPNSVLTIQKGAFSGCSSLSTVTLSTATGWKANGTAISQTLSDTSVAATCLKDTYADAVWTRQVSN